MSSELLGGLHLIDALKCIELIMIMLVFLVRFFVYLLIFFLHFSFYPKSISRKHTLADIYKIKIVFFPPPPPSLPPSLPVLLT